ncbi:hypothetical protein HanRHA438_Chr04g0165411 [Helianthus annuus]|nr:hypothetical protein HanRHA438_Chr04g0165411 [Helianthus annuus]
MFSLALIVVLCHPSMFGLVWFGSVWFGLVWSGLVCRDGTMGAHRTHSLIGAWTS